MPDAAGRERMIVRQAAAARQVVSTGACSASASARTSAGARRDRAAAGDDQRPRGAPQRRRRGLDLRRIAARRQGLPTGW